ncbi:MAG TPA: hypothetical protein VI112_01250 [Bacteroidia bacterium]|jgi:hypothetical protein
MKNNIRIILFVALIIGIAVWGYFPSKLLDDTEFPNRIIPSKYLSLFTDSAKEDLEIRYSQPLKHRDTITIFFYKKKFEILLMKFNETPRIPLEKYISEDKGNSSIPFKSVHILDFGGYKLSCLPEEALKTDFMHLVHCCNPISGQYLKNDTVFFRGMFSSFSIRRGENGEDDTMFESKAGDLPTNILFLKRQGGIFLVVLTPSEKGIELPENLLLGLIKKQVE